MVMWCGCRSVLRCVMVRVVIIIVFFFKQKTAYEMRISDWSSDVCSSDLGDPGRAADVLAVAEVEAHGGGLAVDELDPDRPVHRLVGAVGRPERVLHPDRQSVV